MRSARLWMLLCAMLAGNLPVFAQTNPNEEQGLKPNDSFHGGDLDSVSLTSGGLSLHIPLASFPQRGNLDLSFMVAFSNKQWYVKPAKYDRTGHQTAPAQWAPMPNTGVQIVSSTDWWLNTCSQVEPSDPNNPGGMTLWDWSDSISSPDGSAHVFGDQMAAFSPEAFPVRSLDGTGLVRPDARTLILPNGTRYSYPGTNSCVSPISGRIRGGVQASSVTDANGNQITVSSSGWTDTMGRFIPGAASTAVQGISPGVATTDVSKCPSGTTSARIWNVPGISTINGGVRTFYFCYSMFPLSNAISGSGASSYGPVSTSLLSAVVLPDLTMWTFTYDNYGDVMRVSFPTGGSLAYTYATGPFNSNTGTGYSTWVVSRTVDANDGTGGHQWIYNYQPASGFLYAVKGTATVTDPAGNDVIHTIGPGVTGSGCPGYEYQTQYFQGPASGGVILKTVQNQFDCTMGTPGGNLDGISLNSVPTQGTITFRGGQSSKAVSTYDSIFNDPNGQAVRIGSVLQRDEYDFSNTLARSTVNRYLWQDNPPYLPINFVSLKSSVTLKDGAGNQVAQTTYGYDDVSRIFAYGNSMGQVAAPAGSARGNLNYVSRWLNTTNTMITTTTNVYDTGEPYQTIDPLGNITKFTYSPSFYGAYLTQTNLPDTQMPDSGAPVVHHVISGNYDFNTGVLTNFTDENGQPYSYTYDIMLRLAQGNHPDGGITKFFYPDPNTVERQRLITGTTYDDFKVKFDGVGRPYQTLQFTPECASWIKVDTGYDSVGRAKTVSNPYCLTSEPTYGVTQTTYDALSRTLNTTKQDGSVTSVKYDDTPGDNVRAPLVCTTATDESGKKRQACSDAFGRLVKVMEPNPGAAATNAFGSVTISGSEQTTNTSVSITVASSGFETPALGSGANAYQYHPTGSSWTFGPNSGLDSNNNIVGGSGITGNNSGFTSSNPSAPEGAQVAFLQGGSANYISQSLSGFQAGVSYTVSFQAAQRGNSNTGGQDFDVYLDSAFLATFRPASTNYALLSTPAFTTTAGVHTLKFVGRDSAGGNGNAAFIDAVQVTWSTAIPDSGTVTVSIDGTPYTYNYGASDNAGTIAAGLANTINSGSLAHATSTADANLTVANSGFETPTLGASNFQYNPTAASWIFSGGTGISANGSGFTSGNPGAPEGGQVAFIQMGANSVISQTLSGFQTGMSYTVSFSAAQRANFSNGGQDFDVYLDATLLGTFRPGSTSYSSMSTAPFTTTAGTHTLQFVGRDTAGGDNTAFIDAVRVTAPVGNSIILTSNTSGSAGDYAISTSYTWNNTQFTNPSFTTSASGSALSGAKDAAGLNNNPFVTLYQYNARGDMLCVHQKATDTTADVPCTGASAPSVPATWRQRFFTYDSFSRLLTAMNPELNSTGSTVITYGYDNNSRLTSKIEPAPNAAWGSSSTVTLTYTYDALNRLLDTTFSDGTTLKASHRYDYATFQGQSFTNPIGREVVALTVNSSGSTVASTFASYDVMGRVANTVQCNPGVSGCKTFTASYDKLGDLTSVAYPGNGFTVTYGYDSAARLTTATDSAGVIYAQTPTYLASGAIQEFTSPNFANNKYHVNYNNRLQPVEIWAGSAQGAPALFDKQYSYGTAGANNGNIFTITNVKDSTRTQSFSYDPLNRLITAGDNGHWANTYTYDAWGNLTNKTPGSPAGENLNKAADANNHLSGLTYDAAGNVINDGLGGAFVFDGENRIKTAGSVTYTYDAYSRRIQKSTGSNYWYGPGGQVFAETDSAGNWTNYIFFGGQRLARNVSGDIKYYITDHLHSTAMFVDKAGTTAAILDDNDMYPWGGVVPGVGKNTSNNTIKFTGKYRDADTAANLDYFGARYYSNTVGRFMSPDWGAKPIAVPYAEFVNPQSLNIYIYAHNNPIVHMDVDGHDILVIENGPTQGNPIGHTAMAITGQGVFSSGNDTKRGSSTAAYLKREAPRRESTVFILKTTPAQDKAAADYLRSQPEKLGGVVLDNCATRTNRALDAANIPQPAIVDDGALPANNMPGWAGYRAASAGATQVVIPKGSKSIPGSLDQFEPGAQQPASNGNAPPIGTTTGTYYFRDGSVITVTNDDDAKQQTNPMIDPNSGYSVGPR